MKKENTEDFTHHEKKKNDTVLDQTNKKVRIDYTDCHVAMLIKVHHNERDCSRKDKKKERYCSREGYYRGEPSTLPAVLNYAIIK